MESLYLFLALVLSLAVIVLMTIFFSKLIRDLTKLHYEEKEDLFMKLASKSLSEAEFYRKEYPKEVDEKAARMEIEREKPPTKEQEKREETASQL